MLVTGSLGASRAGLSALRGEVEGLSQEEFRTLVEAHRTPRPRVLEGQAIAATGAATAMIDLSDGLASDIGHLCDASGVGVRIWSERIPLEPNTRRVAQAAGADPLSWALGGGEDYELCFTVGSDRVEAVSRAVAEATGTPVAEVGEIVAAAEERVLVDRSGAVTALSSVGWDHMKGT